MTSDDEIREFLAECSENLHNLDQQIVAFERNPEDAKLLDSIFRTFHTVKGTSGFFGFVALGAVAHAAENILVQIRNKKSRLTPPIAALLLLSVDAIKAMLAHIEQHGVEGDTDFTELITKLDHACDAQERVLTELSIENATKDELDVPPSSVKKSFEKEEIKERSPQVSESSIRVNVLLLDQLMNLVGELVLARNQLLQEASREDNALTRSVHRLNAITSELQESVLKTRMQPIGVVWGKLPRIVRDVASETGKKIRIEMRGTETELDKTIIEAIKDPLVHIVRNACDHGIETMPERAEKGKCEEGVVSLLAHHEGGHVYIEIRDDGKGIDTEKVVAKAIAMGLFRTEDACQLSEREKLQLIFLPGFSTASKITNISGRGVGMDVVQTNIQKIGGSVEVCSDPGNPGTLIKIKIPLTLAIIPGLIVRTLEQESQEQRYVIPQTSLLELLRIPSKGANGVEHLHDVAVFRRRGQLLTLVYLDHVLGIAKHRLPQTEYMNVVVVEADGRPFGLIVDEICDTQEIVVKPLGNHLKALDLYAGATIMGDGHVALILDVPGIARRIKLSTQINNHLDHTHGKSGQNLKSFLLFRDATHHRLSIPLECVSRLEQIKSTDIQLAAGKPALDYLGGILPLVSLSDRADSFSQQGGPHGNKTIVVLEKEELRLGVLADVILDVIQSEEPYLHRSQNAFLQGSMVIEGSMTDLVNVDALMRFAYVDDTSFLASSDEVLYA